MEVVCSKLLRDSFCFSIGMCMLFNKRACISVAQHYQYVSGTAMANRMQRAQLIELRAERVTQVPQSYTNMSKATC